MTSDPSINAPSDEPENGVLAETGAIDTSDLGLLTTNTAHVNVILPTAEEDDDDDVVDDDDISILFDSLLSGDAVTAQQEDVAAVVVGIPHVAAEETTDPVDEIDLVEAELVEDDLPSVAAADGLVVDDADDLAEDDSVEADDAEDGAPEEISDEVDDAAGSEDDSDDDPDADASEDDDDAAADEDFVDEDSVDDDDAADEVSADDDDADEVSAQDVSVDDVSLDDDSVEVDASADVSAEDDSDAAEGTTSESASIQDDSVQADAIKDEPSEDISVEDEPFEDISTEDVSVEDDSLADVSVEDDSVEDDAIEDVSAEDDFAAEDERGEPDTGDSADDTSAENAPRAESSEHEFLTRDAVHAGSVADSAEDASDEAGEDEDESAAGRDEGPADTQIAESAEIAADAPVSDEEPTPTDESAQTEDEGGAVTSALAHDDIRPATPVVQVSPVDAGEVEDTVTADLSAGELLAGATGGRATVTDSASAQRNSVEEPPVSETRDIHDLERVTVRTGAVETTPAPRRLGDVGGDASRETPDLLTADRLLDPNRKPKPEPEGAWQHFVYSISGKRINLGDGKRARERKALTERIAAPITGGSRFVPVLSRKGGVGKTTVTTLIGMALADARDDRVVAVDANPDRGTLAERISRSSTKTVRDLVRVRDEIRGYNDLSGIVSRDETRLDVLASDSDPRVAEAFSDIDYRHVADVASRYYSIVLTDTGTGIVHSVMGATLDLADQLVIVAGRSVDEARAASETLTWLETNGFSDIARRAIVVLNQTSAGAPVVRMDEVEEHFRTRVSEVVRIPYDPMIASGSAITFRDLQPETRVAARELAALVVNGLRGTGA
ncbi:AAA family ATPase [Microbacterium sp. GXS0129]|uniref:nucleotide-binding protein n=1 Tax=Microbacterium sp. GXS0129 TaxID=3377836 RepID=UPI00383AF85A